MSSSTPPFTSQSATLSLSIVFDSKALPAESMLATYQCHSAISLRRIKAIRFIYGIAI